jgi:hypothetical protein
LIDDGSTIIINSLSHLARMALLPNSMSPSDLLA